MTETERNANEPSVPDFRGFLNPCLDVLRKASGPLANDDIDQAVAKHMNLPRDVLSVVHGGETSGKPEAFYRLAWARSYLKKVGLIDNPARGSWEISERGRTSGKADPAEVVRLVAQGADAESLTAEISEAIAEELLALYPRAIEDRDQPTGDALAACYGRFREKFGPERLRHVQGETLLELMHGRGTKDSLAYWLEFKNDEEFPGPFFGSISGGSALKFGIYQSAESGHWMTGHPASQKRLSKKEAIRLVEGQRDRLLAGVDVLAHYKPATADYAEIQSRMLEAAPDLAESAWGHKYFALLFPELLDDYHSVDYQKYHLIRLHKLPGDGRYENARYFMGIARQLEIPVTHLGSLLNLRDGNPQSVWRVGTSVGSAGASEWPRMRDGGFAAIGWDAVGDLSAVEHNRAGKDIVRGLMEEHFPAKKGVVTRATNQLFAFATRVREGDTIVAMAGGKVLGMGVADGPYYFQDGDGPFPHRRSVTWRSTDEWKLPKPEALQTTFAPLRKYPGNLVEIVRRLDVVADEPDSRGPAPKPKPRPLTGVVGRIQAALARKGQVILYGPPGTGKTYWANRAMNELASRAWFGLSEHQLSQDQGAELSRHEAIVRCTFHPAYGYEDFLIGYRPSVTDGSLIFVPKNGIFASLCERAAQRPDKPFFLLVDEINRGDIPRIFGELLTVLEMDKRGQPVRVPLSEDPFVVPANVRMVGTMNTADRSIALLDAALRRRFAFIELMPDSQVLQGASIGGVPIGPWLDELNRRVVRHAGRDSRNLQVGHSYLMVGGGPLSDRDRFAEVLRDDIVPLLQEYCYDDFEALEQILGPRLVLAEAKRIDESLFEPARRGDLFEALLEAFEGITATSAAALADVSAVDEELNDDDNDADDAEED